MISQPHPRPLIGRAACAALLVALTLSGCSDTRRALGYDKSAPDEFAVVSRAPLSQPPDFTLRPPMPGAPRPQEGTTRDQAKGLLLGGRAPSAPVGVAQDGASQGEKAILAKAGAEHAQADIRRVIDEETARLIDADKSLSDKILFWQEKPPPGEVVDPVKEARRLEENASLGKPATDGKTPEIVRRKKGWLEDIF